MKTFIVLGCCRTGTTVTTKLLTALGVDMDIDMGHAESEQARLINSEMLESVVGHNLDNKLAFPPLDMPTPTEKIRRFIEERGTECWGFKNPKTSLTIHKWIPYLDHAHFVVTFRNPIDTARSLMKHRNTIFEEALNFVCFVNARIAKVLAKYIEVPRLVLNLENIKLYPKATVESLQEFVGGKAWHCDVVDVSDIIDPRISSLQPMVAV